MPTKQQIINWSLHDWSFAKIAKKYGTSRQRIYQIYNSKDKEVVEKEVRIREPNKKSPEYYKARHRYYCRSCEQFFWSKLGRDECICVKCGSSRII